MSEDVATAQAATGRTRPGPGGGDRGLGRPALRSPRVLLLQALVAVVVVVGWQVLADLGVIDSFYVSTPLEVAAKIGEWASTGFLWENLWITAQEGLLGLVIGSLLGVVVGFAFARWRLAAAVFDPYVKMLNAMPRIVLAPLFILWLGFGVMSKVAVAVSLVFFIVFFNTYRGLLEVDKVMVDNVRMLGANERQLRRHVLIPNALSWMFSSLHISLGLAIIGAVVGEFVGATGGIGFVIVQARSIFDTAGVMAGIVVLMVFVLCIEAVVTPVERYLLRWRSTT
jgi:NitT/TauT family transport system permease protein